MLVPFNPFSILFLVLKTSPVRLDELDVVGNQPKTALVAAVLAGPFLLVKRGDDANSRSLVQALGR